jgi:hypothetical protein
MKPYPHLYVKPIFRPDFYGCIMSHLPPSAVTEVGGSRVRGSEFGIRGSRFRVRGSEFRL